MLFLPAFGANQLKLYEESKNMIIRVIFIFLLIGTLFFHSYAECADTVGARGVLQSSNARYVFGTTIGWADTQYMLDTKTGRLWQVVKSQEAGRIVLQQVPYISDGKLWAMPDDPLGEVKVKK